MIDVFPYIRDPDDGEGFLSLLIRNQPYQQRGGPCVFEGPALGKFYVVEEMTPVDLIPGIGMLISLFGKPVVQRILIFGRREGEF